MADHENRWRRDRGHVYDSDDRRSYGRGDYGRNDFGRNDQGRGDIDRELLETSRRMEQRHDYSPDLIADMRYFSGADGEREYAARRYGDARTVERADTHHDYGHSDFRRSGQDRQNHDRNDRGFVERAGDEMASWAGNDDAERRRRMDARRGDSGAQHHQEHGHQEHRHQEHHRGRGPRGYARSDERIREDVNDRLTEDPYVDASDIEVSVSNREVTLTGTVDDRRTKRRAEDLAESVSGVSYVQNNLRVRQTSHGGTGTAAGASAMAGFGGDPYRRRY